MAQTVTELLVDEHRPGARTVISINTLTKDQDSPPNQLEGVCLDVVYTDHGPPDEPYEESYRQAVYLDLTVERAQTLIAGLQAWIDQQQVASCLKGG